MVKIALPSIVISCLILVSILIKLEYFGITPFVFWLFSIFITICIFPPTVNFPKKNSKNYYPYLIIILITVLYSLRGILFIDPSNLYFHGDEGIISRNAQNNFINTVNLGKWNLFGSEEGTLNRLPAIWYFIQGFIINVLGPSIFSIKFFSLITDFFICVIGYLLLKKFLDHKFGLIFILIYATLPISVHFSLTGYQNIQSTLFLIISVYFLLSSFQNQTNKSFFLLLSGITSSLSFYFYLSATIVPVILICCLFCFSLKNFFKTFTIYLIGLIEGLIPYLASSYFHYSFITGRKEAILSFNFSKNIFELLFTQVKTYLSGFLPTGSMSGSGFFYGYLPGFNSWILLVLFLVGIIFIFSKRNLLGIISLVTIVVTSITGGILTSEPPAPQRLIHLFPFMVIVICFGLKFITHFVNKKFFLLFIVAIIFSTNVYFFIHSNLSTYHTFFNQDVSDIFRIVTVNPKPIYFSTYSTKINQIYYLTNGLIDPQVIYNCDNRYESLQRFKSIYFVVGGSNILPNCDFRESITLVKEWNTVFGPTSLYQLDSI